VLTECDMQGNYTTDWSNVPHDDDGRIDWDELVYSVNMDAILLRHDRTAQS
jgi:hypothetical protein